MALPPDTAAYARVTVLAPRHRVDVALPADVPVGELVPMVLELIGEPPAGHSPLPWRLTGATGGRLHPNATLDELGVLDGELLRIGPAAAPPPPPVFDDPVDALASTVGGPRTAGRGPAARVALVLAAAAAAALTSVAGDGASVWTAGAAALGLLAVGAALTRAALSVRRENRAGATTAALAAVPLAAATGALAFAAVPGGPQLLLAVAAAGAAAAAGQVVLRAADAVLVAIVTGAVPVGVALVVHLRFEVAPSVSAAAVGALALVVGPLLPRAALRLAGLPRPLVPADAGELADADDGPDLLPPAEFAARAELARGYLAGLVGGTAVLAAGSVLPVAATGGWAGPSLAAVIVAVLALRARGFADPGPARTLLAAALAAGVGLAALTAVTAGAPVRFLVATLLTAAAGVALAAARSVPVPSPVTRRAVDLAEGVLVAAAVPLALGVMGLYTLVRGL